MALRRQVAGVGSGPMSYRPPLHVNERMFGTIELVDADGRVIASAETRPWHGVRLEQQPDFVRENFQALADAANGQCSKPEQEYPTVLVPALDPATRSNQ